jgi:biopolymer transport protein ExbB
MDLHQMFQQSGPLGWPLLACSILAVGVAIERTIVFLWQGTSYQRFQRQLRDALNGGGIAAAGEFLRTQRSPLARVTEVYLKHEQTSDSLREEVVSREASIQLSTMERRVHWLSVIGSLAPMIGLLGTVLGLVQAFKQIESLGGQVQPGDLAAGIWMALLTTVFGLTVALPTLAVYHFLEHRVGAVQLQLQWLTSTLNEWFGHNSMSGGTRTVVVEAVHEDVVVSAGE